MFGFWVFFLKCSYLHPVLILKWALLEPLCRQPSTDELSSLPAGRLRSWEVAVHPGAQRCSLWGGEQPHRVVKAVRLLSFFIPVQYKKQYICSEKNGIQQQAVCCHSNDDK